MKPEQEEPGTAPPEESASSGTNRRVFLGKSLGAVPIILTVGGRHGGGGASTHGTLWSSTGTDWKHRGGRWWKGGGWDKPKPPHFDTHGKPSEHGGEHVPPRADWDWQTPHDEWQEPREDWRKWRPQENQPPASDWDWKSDKGNGTPAQDIPVHRLDETVRDKK
jgi:hypothetical protein